MSPKYLENLILPQELQTLDNQQLLLLAEEVREKIISTCSQTGGHLASNLGVVELTIALLTEFDFGRDKVVFDVGHQSYPWKLLTGRHKQFCTLRQLDGLAGFPKQSESCYDFFNTGHSSTSISAALGLSRAMSRQDPDQRAIALIGDGALTGGMAFEALNDAGQAHENLIVILNDNQMSISKNVGGLSKHLDNLRISPNYLRLRSRVDSVLPRIPLIGKPIYKLEQQIKRIIRRGVQQQGILFEQLGFQYYGPVDGHDLESLRDHLKAIRQLKGPVLLHVLTQKGKGYKFAEDEPSLYHGVAPFIIEQGVENGKAGVPSYSQVFGRYLVSKAKQDPKVCAISAAMTSGTGLGDFAQQFPERFYDVGIAEQHAVTMAAGLAAGGLRPVVALYSTFLQRAYDQLLHDICLQSLPVVLAIDRAGIVGEDGETHQGLYDLGFMLPMPSIEIFCPVTAEDMQAAFDQALLADHPTAIRYPRGKTWQNSALASKLSSQDIHKARLLRTGQDLTLVALGSMTAAALAAADLLEEHGLSAEVLSVVCAKPVDLDSIIRSLDKTGLMISVEESLVEGGFGQTILPKILNRLPAIRFDLMGIDSKPLGHGKRGMLLARLGLDPEGIARRAVELVSASK